MDCNRKFLHFLEFSRKSSCSFCGLRFGTVLNGVFCLFEHRLGENPVASGGVIDQNMGHSTHEAPILEDGASAHALHDAAGRRQKRRIGHPDDQIPAGVGVADPLDLDAVSAGRFPLDGSPYLSGAGDDFLRERDLPQLAREVGACRAVDAVLAVDADGADGVGAQEMAL